MAIRRQATAGMVADTSLYNIDGACVLGGSAPLAVGTAVGVASVDADGHKVVANTTVTAANLYGVAVRSHYEAADGLYKPQEAINVMSHGRVWMRAAAEIEAANRAFGTIVSLNATGLVATGSEGTVVTSWTFAGGYQAADAVSGEPALVEVQVKQK